MNTPARAPDPEVETTSLARLTFSLPLAQKREVQRMAAGLPGGASALVRVAIDRFLRKPVIDLRDEHTED